MAILETHDIGKRYARRRPWALRHLDLSVPDGSITALVGPNGSGKSTLLKAWVGFERPTEGRLLVDGIDPWKDRGAAVKRIGYVPQAPSLYRELTVDEHVRMAGTAASRASTRRSPGGVSTTWTIPLASRADELSGGQQAQVGLALALGARAPVLLLDEPLASLDPLARREFLHVLVDAVRSRRSDRAPVVARHHRHRAGLRPAAGARERADAPRPLDRRRDREHIAWSSVGPRATAAPVDGARSSGVFPGPAGERLASSAAHRSPAGARRRSRRSCSATWPPGGSSAAPSAAGSAGGMTWRRSA